MSGVLAALLASRPSAVIGGPAMEFIETIIVTGSAATSVTFSSIPQDYKHLQIRYASKSGANTNQMWIRMNGNSSAIYSWHQISGNATAVSSSNGISESNIIITNGQATTTTGIWGAQIVDILGYTSTLNNKTIRALGGVAGADAGNQVIANVTSGLFGNTGTITSLTLLPPSNLIAINSRFSLYGIKG